ncbi:MAG: hypothetical protein JNM78_06370 [Cyclobacteriaceae bacterium]|nr:hypothetical protein [Cyclobacteriaceae bacterium]
MLRLVPRDVISLLLLILVCGCVTKSGEKTNNMDTTITVSGLAQNGKGGALLLTLDSLIYYIEGVDFWNAEVVGKKIQATGILRIETVTEGELKNELGEYSQGVVGDRRILTEVKWERGKD